MSGRVANDRAGSAQALLEVVGTALSARAEEIALDIREAITAGAPELRGDERVVQALTASVEGNVLTLFHVMRQVAEVEEAAAPPAAIGYARQLAQHGTSNVALLRAYRLGHARFLRWCLDELYPRAGEDGYAEALSQVVALSFDYIDRVSEQVVRAYEAERDRWSRNLFAVRGARIGELLAGDSVDLLATERALGYRLRQRHVAVVGWSRRQREDRALLALEQAVARVAAQLDSSGRATLFIPHDDASAWAWIAIDRDTAPTADTLNRTVDDFDPPVHLALGDAGFGLEGFRQTHREALRAQAVAFAGGDAAPKATRFRDVASIASLAQDLGYTRAWVRATLGELAVNDASHRRLRETARLFLASGGSYTATAELLHLHKNTVQYRVQRAEELLGRSLREGRIELELALLACHWMADAVLGPER